MSNELTKKSTGTQLTNGGDPPSVTSGLVNSLSPEERQKYAVKALDVLIERERSNVEMLRRHEASTVGIERDIDTAHRLNKAGSDFTLESQHKTASGETRIKVTKNNNTAWIVAMVVIALIFFVLFSR